MDHTVCPGSKIMRQPAPEQFTCPKCNSEVEIWSDEISGKCGSCGTTVVRDGTMSCIEWCAMARDCVGDDVFNDFQDRKAITIKDRLMELASAAAEETGISIQNIERSIFYAENIARSEEALLHVVLAGTVFSTIYHDRTEDARKELLKLGFQLEDIEEVCGMVGGAVGQIGEASTNESVIHDALLLAAFEDNSAHRFAGDAGTDPEKLRYTLKTRSGAELLRHVSV